MPRIARVVVPGLPYHITHRGNNRQIIFFDDMDRKIYLEMLSGYAGGNGVSVLGYCLMTNHVHLVAVPDQDDSLSKAIGRAHFRYSQYVNRRYGRSGHLWEGRFYSAALDDVHLFRALCYVERNPIRARMVRKAWNYAWSSAGIHVGERRHDPLIDVQRWRELARGLRWRQELCRPQDEEVAVVLRQATRTGRPLGSRTFVDKLELALHRKLHARPIGRPKKILVK